VFKEAIKFLVDKKNWCLTLIFLFFLGLTTLFYGRNLIKYQSLFPKYGYDLERDCPSNDANI
jgi:hypothetical protein